MLAHQRPRKMLNKIFYTLIIAETEGKTMLSRNDLQMSDAAAEAAFGGPAYETDYSGDILFFADGPIYSYDCNYFAPDDAFSFLKVELGAETLPSSYYGKTVIDYMGRNIAIDEDTYVYQGYTFYSDESLDFICFVGAKEVIGNE